jgi:hypothetical protein
MQAYRTLPSALVPCFRPLRLHDRRCSAGLLREFEYASEGAQSHSGAALTNYRSEGRRLISLERSGQSMPIQWDEQSVAALTSTQVAKKLRNIAAKRTEAAGPTQGDGSQSRDLLEHPAVTQPWPWIRFPSKVATPLGRPSKARRGGGPREEPGAPSRVAPGHERFRRGGSPVHQTEGLETPSRQAARTPLSRLQTP